MCLFWHTFACFGVFLTSGRGSANESPLSSPSHVSRLSHASVCVSPQCGCCMSNLPPNVPTSSFTALFLPTMSVRHSSSRQNPTNAADVGRPSYLSVGATVFNRCGLWFRQCADGFFATAVVSGICQYGFSKNLVYHCSLGGYVSTTAVPLKVLFFTGWACSS